MAAAKTKNKVARVTKTLIKHHRHAGADLEPGATVSLTAKQVSRLEKRGVIDKV